MKVTRSQSSIEKVAKDRDELSVVDEYLGFSAGTFDHIPHYAREHALDALLRVRELEQSSVFRPGLYYVVLADLCRATEASNTLGDELSRKRVETFILTCIEVLGYMECTNYHLVLREVGDAVLLLFSSFADVHEWWQTMHSWLDGRNHMWITERGMTKKNQKLFKLDCKTIVHVGEIGYSADNIPLSAAVNQVFKAEKEFGPGDLGLTALAMKCVAPLTDELDLQPRIKSTVVLPGSESATELYVVKNYAKQIMKMKRNSKTRPQIGVVPLASLLSDEFITPRE